MASAVSPDDFPNPPTRPAAGYPPSPMNAPRTPVWLLVSAAVLLAAVVASGVVGLRAIDDLSYEFAVADRPAEVQRTLGELLSAAQDIETGQRGYLLSGNEVYLEPYSGGLGEVDSLLARLDRLVSWNPVQVARMPVLRGRVDSVRSYYATSVALRRTGGLGPAVARVESGEGLALMDSVRSMVRTMEREAVRVRELRQRHVARAKRSARRALWASTVALAVALALAALGVARTLRARDAASASLARSADELARSNDALSQALAEREQALLRVRAMQGQLVQQEKLAGLGRLTAGVAHELKNPLNFVTNFAALSDEIAGEIAADLAAGRTAEAAASIADLRANTRRVVEHADRADGIVRSMLTHARGVTGSREPVDLGLVVSDATANALGPAADDVRVVVESPGGPVVVEGVALALGRLFQNLIANAVYAVRERAGLGVVDPAYTPTVTVRTRVEDDHGVETAVVEVEDNGAGIPDADLPRIFEPFFTTKAPGQGTGLGLPLAHDIAVGHGGSLLADRAPGGGALFTVRLPVHGLGEAAEELAEPAGATGRATGDARRQSYD